MVDKEENWKNRKIELNSPKLKEKRDRESQPKTEDKLIWGDIGCCQLQKWLSDYSDMLTLL